LNSQRFLPLHPGQLEQAELGVQLAEIEMGAEMVRIAPQTLQIGENRIGKVFRFAVAVCLAIVQVGRHLRGHFHRRRELFDDRTERAANLDVSRRRPQGENVVAIRVLIPPRRCE
jgi:hypothetical protein